MAVEGFVAQDKYLSFIDVSVTSRHWWVSECIRLSRELALYETLSSSKVVVNDPLGCVKQPLSLPTA